MISLCNYFLKWLLAHRITFLVQMMTLLQVVIFALSLYAIKFKILKGAIISCSVDIRKFENLTIIANFFQHSKNF